MAYNFKIVIELIADKVSQPKTITSVVEAMIFAGQTDAAIWAVIQPWFHMPDRHETYPRWFRNRLKRQGKLV